MCPMQESALSALIAYLPKEKLPARYAALCCTTVCQGSHILHSFICIRFVHVLFTFFRGNTICIAAVNRV